MTSPVGGKPESTQDKYDDVHSRGTSFGAELDEQSVRKLLGGQIESPFAKALGDFFDAGTAIINEVADAIGGVFTHDGQRSKPIYDAIIAQMGPVKTQVNTLGQHLQELSTEVTERIDNQETILGETQGHINDMSTILDEQTATLAQNQEDLDAARQETSTAIEQSGEAVSLAKSYNKALTKRITIEFNKAMGEAGKAITQAEANNAELGTMNTQLGEITQQASELNTKLGEHNKKFTDGLADANSAIDEAVSVTAAVKKLAEKNQAKVSDAVSKAEKANADLALMSPKVADAVAKSDAATDNVATLTPKVSDAVTQAGAAVDKADAVTSAYNTFKTQQKARIDTAVSKAEKATSDVSTLTPKVSDAVSKAGKASSDVSALTPKVTSASEDAAKASQDVAALTPKVTAAQDKADKAASDLSTLTPKVTAAQNRADSAYTEAGKVRSEVTPKIEDAQTKGETALAAADKAIAESEFVAGFADDLIPKDANGKSTWSQGMPSVDSSPEGSAFGSERTFLMDNSFTTPEAFEPVKGQEVYRLTVWIYRDPNASSGGFSFLVVDDNYDMLWEEARLDLGDWITLEERSHLYTVVNYDVWEKHILDFRWPESLGPARIRFRLNPGNAFYIHDPQVRVIQPLDNSVDRAQNDAIKANQDILRQQEEINEAQRVANLAQDNFNDSQTKWNTTSENATQALADADQAQKDINAEQKKFNDFHTQFTKDQMEWNDAVDRSIATQATVNGNFDKWTDGADKAIQANTDVAVALARINGIQVGGRNLLRESLFQKATSDYLIHRFPLGDAKPQEGEEVTFSIKVKPGEGTTRFRLYNSNGNGSSSLFDLFINEQVPTPDGVYKGTGKWKDAGGNSHLNVYAYPSSVRTPNEIEWVKLERGNQATDWTPAPEDLPTQAQVDDAQFKALEAHDLLFKKQGDWNKGTKAALGTQKTVNGNFRKWTEGATKAVEANTTAIKALNAPQIGSSIIPLIPGTKFPVWQYHLRSIPRQDSRDAALPEGINAIYRSPGGKIPAGKSETVNIPNGNVVMVDSTVEYEASWWARASAGSARYIYVTLEDETGNPHVVEGLPDGSDYTGGNPIRAIITPATTEWTKYTTRFKFKPGVQFIRFSNIYFSNSLPNAQDAYLYIADLHIGPKIPTQAQVDDAQNQAIKANKDLLVEQERINVEQGKINDLRTDFETEQKKINDKQTGINALNTKVQTAQDAATDALGRYLGISIGGRNLLVDSRLNVSGTDYLLAKPRLGVERPADGDEVTLSVKGQLGEGHSYFAIYNSSGGGSARIPDLTIYPEDMGPDGVYRKTGKWNSAGGDTQLNIYAYPSSAKTSASIEWVKLERGNQGTDWSPAPEEIPDQATLNQNFQDNFEKVDDELGLIKSTDKSFRDDQKKWNKASTEASQSLKEFDKQQTEINNLFQEQLWAQLDMIEQLDIQTPRVLHYRTKEGDFQSAPDWTTWKSCRYHESPFILHLTMFPDTKKMYWVAKGRWEGKLKVTTNWTNGATDVMVYDITRDEANHMAYRKQSTKLGKKARAYAEEGGAWGTDLRNSTFEIYPTHLGRTVGIRHTGSEWYIDQSVMETGGPSMVRYQTADKVRFTNSFYCERSFTGRNLKGEKVEVAANKVVEPMEIRRVDLRADTYVFNEKPFTSNTW